MYKNIHLICVLKTTALFVTLAGLALSCTQKKTGEPDELEIAFKEAGVPLLSKKYPLKDFSLPSLGGKRLGLSAHAGKVVFINFWATWCPPCRAEMPSMNTLYQRFKKDGLEFIAIDMQEDKNGVAAYIRENDISFPVVLDTDGAVSRMYNVQAVPATFVIDREGDIILSALGARDWASPQVMRAFEVLLRHGR